ncbi:sensor histidine kinase [Microbispora sp. ATCC PTA-5024]|uniref:sensor histidine kinase n=1 Tax=Microbispora sp. ATCC PTA-5024 TaxID=316330 RepID=UPI0003DBEFDD|nr:sensor histidine kinase [Microbispora sp. ATCC PTA-5024]ETK33833.1 histidine kinase [Microbispora sp. ATCC PTA-5024]
MTAETASPDRPAPEPDDRPLRERVPLGPKGPIGVAFDPMTWRAVPYLFLSMFLGLAWLAVLSVAVPVSVAMVVVWVGLPLIVVTILMWRGAAMLERRILRLAFGVRIPDPYRRRPGGGFVRHLDWLFGDPATWKDLGYLLLLTPLGALEFFVSLLLWTSGLALLSGPFVTALGWRTTMGVRLGYGSVAESVPWALVGAAILVVALYAVRGMTWLHTMLANLLLGVDEQDHLRAQTEYLRASRARGVHTAETERRRIERDLHDGAQQRLLAVALDLGRARAKFDEDPEAARDLLASAHAGTKEAIAELRDLARGIYPAILTDRGLDAALSSLAARAPVRVELSVEITERPPPAVESIAYFIVSETLTNMAKHSRASEASVSVRREGAQVVVEVADNGVGGATAVPGGGLAGLADRAATIDGVLVVDSPSGGPTRIRASLPCTW